jgi:hypothetical protein
MRAVGAMLVNADNTSNSDCTDMEQLYLAKELKHAGYDRGQPHMWRVHWH